MIEVGLVLNITPGPGKEDHVVFREYVALAAQAEKLGFHSIFALEHHFSDYVLSPSPLQILSYLAARTENIKLGTSVIVLPWNNPIQMAEQIALLDILSNGRGIYCFGRGTSLKEYNGFNIPMAESKSRYLESIHIIIGLLKNEIFSYQGSYYTIPPNTLRPRPATYPTNNFYGSSVSDESIRMNSSLGLGMLTTCKNSWIDLKKKMELYNQLMLASCYDAKPSITAMMVAINSDKSLALETAYKYFFQDLKDTDNHYQYSKKILSKVKGYESYNKTENYFEAIYQEKEPKSILKKDIDLNIVGSPQDCIKQIEFLYHEIGIQNFALEFSYGRMPMELVKENIQLFSDKVLPRIKKTCK